MASPSAAPSWWCSLPGTMLWGQPNKALPWYVSTPAKEQKSFNFLLFLFSCKVCEWRASFVWFNAFNKNYFLCNLYKLFCGML